MVYQPRSLYNYALSVGVTVGVAAAVMDLERGIAAIPHSLKNAAQTKLCETMPSENLNKALWLFISQR